MAISREAVRFGVVPGIAELVSAFAAAGARRYAADREAERANVRASAKQRDGALQSMLSVAQRLNANKDVAELRGMADEAVEAPNNAFTGDNVFQEVNGKTVYADDRLTEGMVAPLIEQELVGPRGNIQQPDAKHAISLALAQQELPGSAGDTFEQQQTAQRSAAIQALLADQVITSEQAFQTTDGLIRANLERADGGFATQAETIMRNAQMVMSDPRATPQDRAEWQAHAQEAQALYQREQEQYQQAVDGLTPTIDLTTNRAAKGSADAINSMLTDSSNAITPQYMVNLSMELASQRGRHLTQEEYFLVKDTLVQALNSNSGPVAAMDAVGSVLTSDDDPSLTLNARVEQMTGGAYTSIGQYEHGVNHAQVLFPQYDGRMNSAKRLSRAKFDEYGLDPRTYHIADLAHQAGGIRPELLKLALNGSDPDAVVTFMDELIRKAPGHSENPDFPAYFYNYFQTWLSPDGEGGSLTTGMQAVLAVEKKKDIADARAANNERRRKVKDHAFPVAEDVEPPSTRQYGRRKSKAEERALREQLQSEAQPRQETESMSDTLKRLLQRD